MINLNPNQGTTNGITLYNKNTLSTEKSTNILTQNNVHLSKGKKAIFMAIAGSDVFKLARDENMMRANRNKPLLPLIACNPSEEKLLKKLQKKELDSLEQQYQKRLNTTGKYSTKETLKDLYQIKKKITLTESFEIKGNDYLKKLSAEDKLYILGHGQPGDKLLGDEDFDSYRSQYHDEYQSKSEKWKLNNYKAMQKEMHSLLIDKNDPGFLFKSAKEIANALKDNLPKDFKNFTSMSCHGADAVLPKSLDSKDLISVATAPKGEPQAFGQELANELALNGFKMAQASAFHGKVQVNPEGLQHTCKVKLADDSHIDLVPRKDLKHIFTPEKFALSKKDDGCAIF